MFAPISALLFLFLSSTLPNGVQIGELPQETDSVEILAGYGSGGLTALASTEAARSLTLTAYAAGGNIEFFQEMDRTGFRLVVPQWAEPMFDVQLAALFKEVPNEQPMASLTNSDFRAKVEEEIRSALLGYHFEEHEYTTDRAFVLFSGMFPASLQEKLAAIPRRAASPEQDLSAVRLPAQRTLRFKSDLPAGAVVIASPISTVYYKGWYSSLLLDRLIKRIMPMSPSTLLPLTLRPHYYRLEVPVPSGQFPEAVEDKLLEEIQRLQFTRADTRDLDAARQDAISYLDSKYVREWFSSHGIPERREEGIEWIKSMSADDMRVAARDSFTINRVIATWEPAVRQTSVEVENLDAPANSSLPAAAKSENPVKTAEAKPLIATPFPAHTHSTQPVFLPERLASGVSIAASNTHAVFISGGSLTRYDRLPDATVLKAYETYRADRVLVLAPTTSMDDARQLWNNFKGSNNREAGVPKGRISSGDLPALFVLKILLDRKLIEAGWRYEVELRISASEGSSLQIQADSAKQSQVLTWIKQIASEPPLDTELAWAREVAVHRFDTARADLQALVWDRDPQGTIQDLETISAGHVSDVARIYF